MKKLLSTFLTTLLLLVAMAGLASACPTCKESVAENGGNLVQGYFWSIIFMMSMPFLIFGGLSAMFYLDVRRARRRKELEVVQGTWTGDLASENVDVVVPAGSA